MSDKTRENALIFIACARAALKNNVKHYAEDGRLLNTEAEILEELVLKKHVLIDVNNRQENTTEIIELEKIKRQYAQPMDTYKA